MNKLIKEIFKEKIGNFGEYKDSFLNSRKYFIVFIILMLISFLSMIQFKNLVHPKFELLTFGFVCILGIFCIFYALRHSDDEELHKTAFVIIICFGLICALLVPICSVSDEKEHLVRAEITSQGVIFPHWNGDEKGLTRLYNVTDGEIKDAYNEGVGYLSIRSMEVLGNETDLNVFQSQHDTDKIDYTPEIIDSAFEQNPFYSYLPQAIGVLIAKLLDLNVIWLLWLARIGNLLCFGALVSLAVKKTPYLKVPLLVIACLPITICQAASVSIDSMIMGLGFLTVSYFIYMYKSEEGTVKNKEIIIFTVICILLGLCKLTYLAFIFLVLFIPRKNFENKSNLNLMLLLSLAVTVVIGFAWSQYATPTLLHSWRSHWQPVNARLQISYILNHPEYGMKLLGKFLNDLIYVFQNQFFNFFNSKAAHHYNDKYYLINFLINIFLAVVLIAYPNNTKFDLKARLGSAGIIILIYFGTCIVQLLSYTTVGGFNLGLNFRYFVPLLALIPIVFQINYGNVENKEFDKYALVISIGFLAVLILGISTKYY